MKRYIHNKVEASLYLPEELDTGAWELIDSKSVYDDDGMLTDYTLWYNTESGEWATVFGDEEIYNPVNAYPDMEFDNEDDAYDWFMEFGTDYEGYLKSL